MSSDLLGGSIDKSSHFFASLVGVKEALRRQLQLPDFPVIHNNDKKIYMRKQGDAATYPHVYASISTIALKEDAQNPKTIRRHGISHAINGTNSTVDKYYVFPIKFDIELHYVVDDFSKAANFILRSLVLLGTEAMNFRIRLHEGGLPWFVRVTMPSRDIAFPLADKDMESDPEGHDIVLNFSIETYHGVVRETAKINNEGKIHINPMLVNGGEVEDDSEE